MNKSAVIFLPETGIRAYLTTLSVFGEALKNEGYDVYLIKCDGISYRCPMLPCCQKPFIVSESDKQSCCTICNKAHSDSVAFYGFKSLNLKDFIDNELILEIDELLNIEKNEWSKIQYKGFNVGEIAVYDSMLESKILSTQNLTQEQQILYGNYLKNTALMVEITDRIIAKIKPSIILGYNPYAQNNAVKYACDKNDVNYKCMSNQHHLGANFAMFMCTREKLSIVENLQHIQNWYKYQNVPVNSKSVRANFDDAIYRMYSSGSHIFSSSKTLNIDKIISELGLDINKKIIGVYTSSYDERLGTATILKAWNETIDVKEVFDNQIEWLKFLREYAINNPDIQFVIRIHPREGKGLSSEHLKMLKEDFSQNPENFKFIWPENQISSYDLLEIIDICLTSHSTIGLEVHRLGIPTLSFVKNLTYPNEGLLEIAESIEDYKDKLEMLLTYVPKIDSIVKASRFYNWNTLGNCLDLSDYMQKEHSKFVKVPDKYQKIIVNILENRQSIVDYNLQDLISQNNDIKNEIESNKLGIRRIIDKIFFPYEQLSFLEKFFQFFKKKSKRKNKKERKYIDYDLIYSEDISNIKDYQKQTLKNQKLRYLVKSNTEAILISKEGIYRKTSKLISNLARMHQQG